MAHSPEPWFTEKLLDRWIIGNDPCGFSGELHGIGVAWTKQDAKRIVACVNACRDIPTNMLEAVAKGDAQIGYISPGRQP